MTTSNKYQIKTKNDAQTYFQYSKNTYQQTNPIRLLTKILWNGIILRYYEFSPLF